MISNLYNELLLMSTIGGILYLIFKFMGKFTTNRLSEAWHYFSSIMLYTFFILPYYKLLSIFDFDFRNAQTFEITDDVKYVKDFDPSTGMISTNALPIAQKVEYAPSQEVLYKSTMKYIKYVPYILLAGTILSIVVIIVKNHKMNRSVLKTCELNTDSEIENVFLDCKENMAISKDIPIYISPYMGTPLIYGMFRPRIVLPNIDFTKKELQQILSHELMHFKRHDTWLKGLLIFINAIHWFNPLAHIARRTIDEFCELSCDERVIKSMDINERRDYCRLILRVLWKSVDQKASLSSAFSNGQKKLERRINMIMKGKNTKNKAWIRTFAIIMTIAIAVIGTAIAYAASDSQVINIDEDIDDVVDEDIKDLETTCNGHIFYECYFKNSDRSGIEDFNTTAQDEPEYILRDGTDKLEPATLLNPDTNEYEPVRRWNLYAKKREGNCQEFILNPDTNEWVPYDNWNPKTKKYEPLWTWDDEANRYTPIN